MLTVKEAQEEIIALSRSFGEETVCISEAYGRVIWEDIISDRDYPPFNRSAMDGYAINSEDFLQRHLTNYRIAEEVHAGSVNTIPISIGECIKIMTGAPVPSKADTVIKVEDTERDGDVVKLNIISLKKGQNIAERGEDIKDGGLIIPKNSILTHTEVSALAVVGKSEIKVHKHPTVAIISTGNEVKPINIQLQAHEIRDSNSYAIEAFLKGWNINMTYKKLVKDDPSELTEAIKDALNYDIIITTGGVSMGDADFLPGIFQDLNIERVFHTVQVKPGKPLWFGRRQQNIVFALPGNPVSTQVACKIFIEPFLRKCFGLPSSFSMKLPMLESKAKKTKFDEYFPCKIDGQVPGVRQVKYNGSGDISATLGSHGIALHPREKENLIEGDLIEFIPWKGL